MAAEFSKELDFRGAYLVDVALINKIRELLHRFTGDKVSISFQLRGKQEISSDDLSEITEDSVLGIELIESITIRSSSYTPIRRSASISFGSFSSPIRGSLSGDRTSVIATSTEISNHLKAAQASYSILFKIWTTGLTFVASIVLAQILTFLYIGVRNNPTNTDPSVVNLTFSLFVLGVLSGIKTIIKWIFPEIHYYFGANQRVYNWRQKVTFSIFSLVVVGGVVGYFVNSISK